MNYNKDLMTEFEDFLYNEAPNCEECNDSGEVVITLQKISPMDGSIRLVKSSKACEDCCEHQELDHGICIDCGRDTDNLWISRTFMEKE